MKKRKSQYLKDFRASHSYYYGYLRRGGGLLNEKQRKCSAVFTPWYCWQVGVGGIWRNSIKLMSTGKKSGAWSWGYNMFCLIRILRTTPFHCMLVSRFQSYHCFPLLQPLRMEAALTPSLLQSSRGHKMKRVGVLGVLMASLMMV